MGSGRNPNKQLVPATRPEKPCPHEYADEQGLVVEVDCASCNGAQDMGNARCFTGLMNIVMTGTAPSSVVLRRYLDKRYRGPAVERLLATADDLASVNRAIGALTRPSDRQCRTCPASKERLLIAVRCAITQNPIGFSAGSPAVSEILGNAAQGVGCKRRDECVSRASLLLGRGRS